MRKAEGGDHRAEMARPGNIVPMAELAAGRSRLGTAETKGSGKQNVPALEAAASDQARKA